MASLTLTDKPVQSLEVDAIVVAVAKGPGGVVLTAGTGAVDAALDGRLGEAIAALGATGAEGEVTLIPTLGAMKAPVVVAAGVGPQPDDGDYAPESVRRAAGAASRALPGKATIASTLASLTGEVSAELAQAAAEGALLGGYEFTEYRNLEDDYRALPKQLQLVVDKPKDSALRKVVQHTQAVVDAVYLARDLVNTPPNALFPAELATRAQNAGRKVGVDVEILDEKALAKGGYGGIQGVGAGSSRPPRLVRMHYKGSRAKQRIALVGKGITFDTGGISLKPSQNMHLMTHDMAGAAAIIASITAIAALKLPVEVTATVPMAENMPGGTAYRPGDVLTMYGGKKVEVLNTDAEGRLVLGDAIARACEDNPAYLIETSTLTGAQTVSLGKRTAGVMGSDDFRDRVAAAANHAGEASWPMPLPPELRTALKSTVADFANVSGDRAGGMLVGGHFLAEFVTEGVEWAHIDVAGPAYNDGEAYGYLPKGATGVPVRTIVAAVEDIAANG